MTLPVFFATPKDLRRWLERNHKTTDELWVGLYKKHTGRPSITWPELVDQVLCFGWIDGIRKSLDARSHKIRITPRRPGSIWSRRNIGRVAELTKVKQMKAAGLKAFAAREEKKSAIYLYETTPTVLSRPYTNQFRDTPGAWEFHLAQPPGYRRLINGWIMVAKKEETRLRRLALVIRAAAAGRRVDLVSPTKND